MWTGGNYNLFFVELVFKIGSLFSVKPKFEIWRPKVFILITFHTKGLNIYKVLTIALFSLKVIALFSFKI